IMDPSVQSQFSRTRGWVLVLSLTAKLLKVQSNSGRITLVDLNSKSKIGLVFSGGGIKAAAFHIGVCLALREKGFRFAGGSKDEVEQLSTLDPKRLIRLYVGSSA